jgi:hypothetical protein
LHWELYWYHARSFDFCTENFTDILRKHCGCWHWELYWYPAQALWLFALRIVPISCTSIVGVCTENCTDIIREHCSCLHWELYWYHARSFDFCTENFTDILHKHCGCWHWELYWYQHKYYGCLNWELCSYPARTLWLFALRIVLIPCTNTVAVRTENCTDILHEQCGCLHWELYWYPARTVYVVVTGSQNLFSEFSSLCHAVFSSLRFDIATER